MPGCWLFQMSRDSLVGTTEQVMAPISYAAIAAIGLWLVFRAIRSFARQHRSIIQPIRTLITIMATSLALTAVISHGPECGRGRRSRQHARGHCVLIAGIAARPCTGALFVLILTWQMGIAMVGVAGAFAMALGTATVTTLVGWTSFGLRGGLLASASATRFASVLAPTIELVAGSADCRHRQRLAVAGNLTQSKTGSS